MSRFLHFCVIVKASSKPHGKFPLEEQTENEKFTKLKPVGAVHAFEAILHLFSTETAL